jgi:hypothetical protein
MIAAVNGVHSVDVKADVRPVAEVRPDPKAQTAPVVKSGEVSGDQVTLKSAGQPDPDR